MFRARVAPGAMVGHTRRRAICSSEIALSPKQLPPFRTKIVFVSDTCLLFLEQDQIVLRDRYERD